MKYSASQTVNHANKIVNPAVNFMVGNPVGQIVHPTENLDFEILLTKKLIMPAFLVLEIMLAK